MKPRSGKCWLQEASFWAVFLRIVSESAAYESLREMARYGTGTVESRAGYPLSETDMFKVLRVQSDHRATPVDLVSTLLLKYLAGTDPVAWTREITEELLPKSASSASGKIHRPGIRG